MLRTHWMVSATVATAYYRNSDYYASVPGDWLGKGSPLLGLSGEAKADDFDKLADNLHPQTGEPLTTYTREGRRVGLDMTFNATKSVSIARELAGGLNAGDHRIEQAHREAVKYTVGMIEKDMQARVRAGGANENRATGNLVAYRATHRDIRINADDHMPDPQLPDHVFIFNATHDAVEDKWKAAEIGQIKHDAPFYEAAYHSRLAHNLKEIGYGIERKGKAFEIAGISDELARKFSRRSEYISKVAGDLGITKPEWTAKLGATTRLGKVNETADDLNRYYVSRLTDKEKQQLASLEGRASRETSVQDATKFAIGHMFERNSVVDSKRLYEAALRHGIGSVSPEEVQEEAKRQGLIVRDGEATTKVVLAEETRVIAFAREGRGTCRQLGAEASTSPSLLASLMKGAPPQQSNGATPSALGQREKGHSDESKPPMVGPLAPGHDIQAVSTNTIQGKGGGPNAHPATLSPEQQAISAPDTRAGSKPQIPSVSIEKEVQIRAPSTTSFSTDQLRSARHVWESPDRVMMIRGAAGTGKTHAMRASESASPRTA